MPETLSHRSFTLVLASGGARGYAHAGVLRVLEAEGLRPSAIVGVSMGAVIGSTYALRRDWYEAVLGVDTSPFPSRLPTPEEWEGSSWQRLSAIGAYARLAYESTFGWGGKRSFTHTTGTLRTVEGTDAAVCILGRTKNNPADVVARGTAYILDAAKQHDVRRLVAVTSIGLGASVTNLPWYGRLANATVLQDLMGDKARQEELVMQSRLDWTIVRPGGLTDGPRTGDYVHGTDVDAKAAPIARADVADFLLRVLKRNLYVREAPHVTTREGVDLGILWQQMRDVTARLLWGK